MKRITFILALLLLFTTSIDAKQKLESTQLDAETTVSAPQVNESNLSGKALEYYRKAVQGDADAQFELAICYEDAKGVSQDYSKAVYWYCKAAEQGDVRAQFNLSCCYAEGKGISQDHSKAAYWYRKAAEQGDSRAQFNLSCCYEEGKGVSQDYNQAVYWYRKAAEQGDSRAQFNLGCCYNEGKGVSQDYSKAAYWYNKAAEQGDARAQENLLSLSRCTQCDGTGEIECPSCEGYGETWYRPNLRETYGILKGCRRCGGGGSKEMNGMTEEVYSDNGFYSGSGVITCPKCNGTGQQSVNVNKKTNKKNRKRKKR